MNPYVLDLEEVDRSAVALVGGKGAHLGELMRLPGTGVPRGFCVTTSAFQRALAEASAPLGASLPELPIPSDVESAIRKALTRLGEEGAYAVRSSATAEDAPTASFAGQLDTYLNVVGADAVLQHVRRCWASLFSERAVAYRARAGLEPNEVLMAVVVQRMVAPDAAGVLFTADPVTGNRKVSAMEAVRGLGDALVSGHVNAHAYKVRGDRVIARTVHEAGEQPALTDSQALRLAALGRRVEAHFGRPQDIEWCRVGDEFHLVQARPITTLFPVPETGEVGNHVFMSVGHNQMMTDAMKPLGLSLWQLTTRRPMYVAGGRLFVELSRELSSPTIRAGFLAMVSRSDPLTGRALQAIVDRADFLPRTDAAPQAPPPAAAGAPAPIETDPVLVADLIRETRASIEALSVEIRSRSGAALLDFILADLGELQRLLQRSHQAAMAGMEATWWLNEKLQNWLGEKNAADTLTLSAPNNVTSEMGLDLLRLADRIRPHAEVVDALERAEDSSFLDELPELPGGEAARAAILGFLDTYGARCVGEIDITRPRWSEQPTAIVPTLLNHIRNAREGAAERLVERGLLEATAKEAELLERLRALPDGEARAEETRRMVARLRTFIGFREYPKFGMIHRYFLYKRALLEEADRLVQAGVLREREDIFFLSFQELRGAIDHNLDPQLLDIRKREHADNERLMPPRVMSSEGEIVTGTYNRELIPEGALAGLPVSSGVVEGRARVVLDLAHARLEPGDILVTRFTDPSWTPVFLGIAGLVAEVGGQMTHGSVIAREHGLPAVVAVEHATERILDGQRIRVNGTEGYVELLPS